MAGFLPVGSFPVASVPGAAEENPNVVNATSSVLLQFKGFLGTVDNLPGLQVEAYSFYAVVHDEAADLQTEQYSLYVAGFDASATLQIEQYGAYIVAQEPPPMQVEAYSLYIVGSIVTEMQVEAYSVYIAGYDDNVDLQIEQFGVYLIGRSTPLVIPALAGIVPEVPMLERLSWDTDIMTSEDGTEQRVNVRAEPRRALSVQYVFGDSDEVRQARRELLSTFREEVAFPLYMYATELTTAADATDTYLTFDPTRTDLRDDGWVLVIEEDIYELKTIDNLDGTGCTITTPLANSYSTNALILPVLVGFADDRAALGSFPATGVAKLSLKAQERVPALVPFVRPGNAQTLTELDGLPILERRHVGDEFSDTYDRGMDVIDFGGRVHYRIPWNFSKKGGERQFLCQRHLNMDDWDYWRVFMDYCKGSVNPFWAPTFRDDDFDLPAPIAAAANIFTASGHSYAEDYFPNPAFRGIMITSTLGVHYATIIGVAPNGDDDDITFDPALPSDLDWEVDQTVCLLERVRLGIDEIGLEHYGLHTLINTSVITADT